MDRTEQQSAQKKDQMKTIKSKISELQSRPEQLSAAQGAAAKYIIIVWNQQEQVIAFPQHVQHSAIFDYIRQENPQVQAVSAGFFMGDTNALWVGGESTSLDLPSRPQDTALVKSFLTSPDRSEWDLTLMTPGGAQ